MIQLRGRWARLEGTGQRIYDEFESTPLIAGTSPPLPPSPPPLSPSPPPPLSPPSNKGNHTEVPGRAGHRSQLNGGVRGQPST